MTVFPRTLHLFVAASLVASLASAETIRLKNGEVLEGAVQHYYGGIVTLTLSNGVTRTVGRDQMASIEFEPADPKKSPAPEAKPAPTSAEPPNFMNTMFKKEAPFASPAATFESWRRAAVAGDMKKMVACYASFRKKEVEKQLKKLSKDAREEMARTTAQTEFVPAVPFYQGDRALLEVKWASGLQGDSQVLQFVLEKDEWKIIQ